MSERVPCKQPACGNTILPETAERTGGFCMPCVQAKAREERAEFVRKNRVDVNPYEGVTDPVEILKIMHRPIDRDPLKIIQPYPKSEEELYGQLSDEEAAKLGRYALELADDDDWDQCEDIARCLAAFTQCDLKSLVAEFTRREHFYPGLVFRHADDATRSLLIERVNTDNENRNLLLCSLAWIDDESIVELFSYWRDNPPDWANELYIPPEAYAHEAGWELSDDRQRRQLYFDTCYPLLKTEDAAASPVAVATSHTDECKWCGQTLTNLLEIDSSDSRLAPLNMAFARLQLTTCHVCGAFGHLFMDLDSTGQSCWSQNNQRPEYLPEDGETWGRLPARTLALGANPRNPLHAASEFLPTSFSQVGGHPTWIQDADYPTCPTCRRTMRFVAQLSCEDLHEYGEGIYYAFICEECQTSTSSYQQS